MVCFSDLVQMDLKEIIEINLNTSMHCIGPRQLVDKTFLLYDVNIYPHNVRCPADNGTKWIKASETRMVFPSLFFLFLSCSALSWKALLLLQFPHLRELWENLLVKEIRTHTTEWHSVQGISWTNRLRQLEAEEFFQSRIPLCCSFHLPFQPS